MTNELITGDNMRLAIAQKDYVTKEIVFVRTAQASELERCADRQEWYGFQNHFEKPEDIRVLPNDVAEYIARQEAEINALLSQVERIEGMKLDRLLQAFQVARPLTAKDLEEINPKLHKL